MSQHLNPYIAFNGTCAEAMEFYAEALSGTVDMMTFREAGLDQDGVMHAVLETPAGFRLAASDSGGGALPYDPGSNVQISLSGNDEEALREYWDRLSQGAHIVIPMGKQMWGDEYGFLIDRFGIRWHVNIALV